VGRLIEDQEEHYEVPGQAGRLRLALILQHLNLGQANLRTSQYVPELYPRTLEIPWPSEYGVLRDAPGIVTVT
jgi:hypothetical protein